MAVNAKRLIDLAAWAASEHAKQELGLPSEWDQTYWFKKKGDVDCGTACCMAGKVVADDGGVPLASGVDDRLVVGWPEDAEDGDEASRAVLPDGREVKVGEYAQAVLGLDDLQAGALFWGGNTLDDVLRVVRELLGQPEPEDVPF